MDRRIPVPRWRRRGLVVKVAIILLLAVCYLLLPSTDLASGEGSSPKQATKRPPLPPRGGSASTLQRLGVEPAPLKDVDEIENAPGRTVDTKPSLSKDAVLHRQPSEKDNPLSHHSLRKDQDVLQPAKEASWDATSIANIADNPAEIARVKAALKNIISILPDEGKIEDILVPFRGTGAVKLRDVGAKARAYKRYFEAWEGLHLMQDSHNAHVRGNVIRFIRDNHDMLDLPESSLPQTLRSYESFRYLVTSLADLLFPWTAPYFADHMALHAGLYKAGRGIVLSAGQDQVPYLLATIPAMRQLGCTLPIEIMYLGDDDISEEYRDILELVPGVVTRDIKQMTRDAGWELAGWAAKPFAMLLSSFQEVMFIDADAVFFRNPADLFDDPQYQKSGALFFKDRSIFPESKRRWLKSILPKPISKSAQKSRLWTGESGHQQESGVVLIDKWRHFIELMLVTRMNGPDRDGNKDQGIEGIYDMVYGDKETFWLAWELLGNSDYAFHEGFRGSMGSVRPTALELPGEPDPPERVQDSDSAEPSNEAMGMARQDLQDFPVKEDKPQTEGSQVPASQAASSEAELDTPAAKSLAGGKEYAAPEPRSQGAQYEAAQPTPKGTQYEKPPANAIEDTLVDTISPAAEQMSSSLRKRSAPRDLDLEIPTNYTICAPQLLHLDADGKPLWFNGWLARNKFKDPTQSVPATFDVWNVEPPHASKTDAWQLGENNEACLTTEHVTEFTKEEAAALNMVTGFAKEVGALGKAKS